ncbi:MAG TPA: endonuclease III [Acidobacteriaceae bacterium]|nr:endonuclease III [Acidobacteriaceae bacterium]
MPAARSLKKTTAKKTPRATVPVRATKKMAPAKAARKTAKKRPAADPTNPQRVQTILDRLAQHYPNAVCALHHKNAWELMVATILSAQCTDVRVNMVTPALFKRFPTPQAMAKAPQAEVEEMIRTTGFFRNKAKNIIGAAQRLIAEFGGKVPQTMEELLTIPGVARKTANVVSGSWYKIGLGVVVDTHVMRITQRLELTKSTTPEKIEQDMMRLLPQASWIDFSHRVIHFGREICIARKPRCADCFLEDICNSKDKTWSTHG